MHIGLHKKKHGRIVEHKSLYIHIKTKQIKYQLTLVPEIVNDESNLKNRSVMNSGFVARWSFTTKRLKACSKRVNNWLIRLMSGLVNRIQYILQWARLHLKITINHYHIQNRSQKFHRIYSSHALFIIVFNRPTCTSKDEQFKGVISCQLTAYLQLATSYM